LHLEYDIVGSYKNLYCALCNDVALSAIKFWDVLIDCEWTKTADGLNSLWYDNSQYRPCFLFFLEISRRITSKTTIKIIVSTVIGINTPTKG